MSAEKGMSLRDMNLRERWESSEQASPVAWCRAELLRAADAVANMHGESATKIAAYLRAQAE